ncbi:MAG: LysM peptidoglycan-binding domain-containing protein [Deltaproteobacteria bacterium]|nr:LysM peptidoglycan-binding domain-containing protein [Deltaproteobacteria bacterium]
MRRYVIRNSRKQKYKFKRVIANPQITDSNHINTGDNINLPSITTATYAVQAGDSISGIADKLGVTIESLIDSNPWLASENRISENGDDYTAPKKLDSKEEICSNRK